MRAVAAGLAFALLASAAGAAGGAGPQSNPVPAASAEGSSTPVVGNVEKAPLVGVRAAEHPTYTRFVFDWPYLVNYEVTGTTGDVLVAFGKPAVLDTRGLGRSFSRLLNASGAEVSNVSTAVRIDVPAGREVRHFRLDNRVVLDLVKQPQRSAASTRKKPAAEPAGAASAVKPADEKKASPAADEETEIAAGPVDAAEVSRLSAAGAETVVPTPAEAAPVEEPRPEELTVTAPHVDEAPVEGQRPIAVPVTEPLPQTHRPTGTAYAGALAETADTAMAPQPEIVARPDIVSAEATRASDTSAGDDRPIVELGFARQGDAFSLSFPGLGDAPAAVFSRAGAVWMVFEEPAQLRLDALANSAPDLADGAAVIGHPSATVLRMEEPAGYGLSARRDGAAWVVSFDKSNRPPYRPLVVRAEPDAAAGARLVIAADQPGAPVSLVDPDAGDRLVAVPLGTPENGLSEAWEYPEVQLLATAQGVAAVQRGDGLLVAREDDKIRITTSAGLLLSRAPAVPVPVADAAAPEAAAPSPRVAPAVRLLDLARWQRKEQAFTDARRQLEQAVLAADDKEAGPKRLDLARFYLARGLAAEALGALDAAGPELAAVAGGPTYHAMRGAANLLAHRLDAAEADLFHADLDDSAEAALWRGAWHAVRGDMKEAYPLFEDGWPIVADYPKWLRQELGLRAAEAALDMGNGERAARYLAAASDGAPEPVRSRARFLEGHILASRGSTLDALAVWKAVAASPDQLAHAKAELAAVKLGLQEKLIGHPEAIDRLERLRFAWRGDALEFETLHLLGRSYLASADYWNGFTTLKEAVTLFSDTLDTSPAAELMTAAFRDLFVGGGMLEMPPLKAVSLYEQFRELTPIGEEGDRVIRELAARLVSLDLLEPAADLLDNQVRYRLEGERRARGAADLALIHLLDKRPADAVEVLTMSAMNDLPEDLASRRRHLLARGLWDMGNSDQALEALGPDRSREAEALRADIYWKAGKWADAAEVYGRMASAPKAGPLSEADGRVVLKWGVAMALARDTAGLRRIGERYGTVMAGTAYEPAFRMITAARPASGTSLATITETLAGADDFQAYLKGYRSALEKSAAVAPSSAGGSTS